MKLICSMAACCVAAAAVAQPLPAVQQGLTQAFENAWQRSVPAREAAGRIARAQAARAVSEVPWAQPPAIEVSQRGRPLHDSASRRETELGLAWPLWLPGQRAASAESTQADTATAQAGLEAARLALAGEVRELAWALELAHAEEALALAQTQTLDALAQDVERRVAAGDLARADALAARAEWLAAQARASEAAQRMHEALGSWKVLTGMESRIATLSPESERASAELLAGHPSLAFAERAEEGARKRLELLRVSRRDAPEISLRFRQDSAGGGLPSQDSVGVALRLPFGTESRNLPREAQALAELDIAQAEVRRQRERIAAVAGNARAAVLAARVQLETQRTRAALARERAQLLERAFRAGESPLPELLRALASATEAEAGLTRQRAALGLAHARLNQSIGVLP